ncbi:hypothetical protein KRR40_26750 [Niabella defluvii]|nr:hypothetical protein KRR40_26750 [Niabella sp. I65]
MKTYDEGPMEVLNRAASKRLNSYYVTPTSSALDKVVRFESCHYNKNEKLFCISVTNEHYDTVHDELKLSAISDWLNITEQQREVIAILDDCKEILHKCGYFTLQSIFPKPDPDFRYGNILSAFDKLKKSDTVFLSRTQQNDYYKIAFVHNNEEYLPFEFSQKISWRNLTFIRFDETSAETIGRTKFGIIASKAEARELLMSPFSKGHYQQETIDTISFLLN